VQVNGPRCCQLPACWFVGGCLALVSAVHMALGVSAAGCGLKQSAGDQTWNVAGLARFVDYGFVLPVPHGIRGVSGQMFVMCECAWHVR
jgi:hypothetical protein